MDDALDDEITELVNAGFYDLEISGVADENGDPYTAETADQLVITAIKTYVKLNLGDLISDTNYWAKLKFSYDEQKAQLKMRTHSSSSYTEDESDESDTEDESDESDTEDESDEPDTEDESDEPDS
jgi:hypothetical protein